MSETTAYFIALQLWVWRGKNDYAKGIRHGVKSIAPTPEARKLVADELRAIRKRAQEAA